MDAPKDTSHEYGSRYQNSLLQRYRNRENNWWKDRIDLGIRLVESYALPRFPNKSAEEINVVDVGCSIGTFAIEMAKLGYRSYGIDFDKSAIELATELSREENVSPTFVIGDVADWGDEFPKIDVAICFDIFEHLHDDEIGSLLNSLRNQLSEDGCIVFHTFPTQYNYILFNNTRLSFTRYPMYLFKYFPARIFNKSLKIYALLVDIIFVLFRGITYKESIKKAAHCNPTTPERLKDIFKRSNFSLLFYESANIYHTGEDWLNQSVQESFSNQPITYRNLYGVAVPEGR